MATHKVKIGKRIMKFDVPSALNGISTRRNPDGLVISFGTINCGTGLPSPYTFDAFVSKEDCERILESIKTAKRKYWEKKVKS